VNPTTVNQNIYQSGCNNPKTLLSIGPGFSTAQQSTMTPPPSGGVFVVNTNYDPNLSQNSNCPYPRGDTEAVRAATLLERELASHAVIPDSKEDFSKKVS